LPGTAPIAPPCDDTTGCGWLKSERRRGRALAVSFSTRGHRPRKLRWIRSKPYSRSGGQVPGWAGRAVQATASLVRVLSRQSQCRRALGRSRRGVWRPAISPIFKTANLYTARDDWIQRRNRDQPRLKPPVQNVNPRSSPRARHGRHRRTQGGHCAGRGDAMGDGARTLWGIRRLCWRVFGGATGDSIPRSRTSRIYPRYTPTLDCRLTYAMPCGLGSRRQ